jgi:hypothetical protein
VFALRVANNRTGVAWSPVVPAISLCEEEKGRVMQKHIVAWFRVWLLAGLAMLTTLLTSAARADEESQIKRGFEIAPVQLDLVGKNRALVGLGSYLVNTTGCNDCHTHPNWALGGNPYLGQTEQINTAQYLSGGRTFGMDMTVDPPVSIVSVNITPDSAGMPAGLTLYEFLDVMYTGHDPDDPKHKRLLKVMPWPLYRWKTDRDLTAMYEYLRAIPSLQNNPNPGP